MKIFVFGKTDLGSDELLAVYYDTVIDDIWKYHPSAKSIVVYNGNKEKTYIRGK